MENQTLIAAWSELQTRVEASIALQMKAHDREVAKRQGRLRNKARWSPIWDIVMSGIALLFTGGYASGNFQALLATPWLALPALAVYAMGIFQINLAVRQLIVLSDLDYTQPVLETQAKLAQLRKLQFTSVKYTLALGMGLWFLPPILILQMLAGPQVLQKLADAGGSWMVGNLLVGIGLGAGVLWLVARSKHASKIQDGLVGKGILEAEAFLQEIREFQAV